MSDEEYKAIMTRIRSLEHQVDMLLLSLKWHENVVWMREQELRLAGVEPLDTDTQCPF